MNTESANTVQQPETGSGENNGLLGILVLVAISIAIYSFLSPILNDHAKENLDAADKSLRRLIYNGYGIIVESESKILYKDHNKKMLIAVRPSPKDNLPIVYLMTASYGNVSNISKELGYSPNAKLDEMPKELIEQAKALWEFS